MAGVNRWVRLVSFCSLDRFLLAVDFDAREDRIEVLVGTDVWLSELPEQRDMI